MNKEWSKEDEKIYQSILDDTVQENQLCNEQINWLKSLKDRVQSKQEWSEEDETHRQWILECLADGKRKVSEYSEQYQLAFDWLKSLCLQTNREWSKEDVPKFTFDDVLVLQYFIESNRSFLRNIKLYEHLLSILDKVQAACNLEEKKSLE